MRKEVFHKFVHYALTSRFRHLLFKVIGFNLYVKLIVNTLEVRGNRHAKKYILCISRGVFDKDVEQLSYRIRKYGWLWLSLKKVALYQSEILAKRCQVQTLYQDTIREMPDQWNECANRSKVLLEALQSKYEICAMMTANFDYWQDHSLKVACNQLGIPVVVQDKEYPISAHVHGYYRQRYRNFSPIADAIVVFGRSLKNTLSDLKGFSTKRIEVTGAPRLDRWRSIERIRMKEDTLVILSFRKGYGQNVERVFWDLVVRVGTYFRDEKLGEIIVKSKNGEDTKAIRKLCTEYKLDHVKVVHEVPLYDLIPTSKAVVGFNSLSVIESMLSDTPILVPNWIGVEGNMKMLDPYGGLVRRAVSFHDNEYDLLQHVEKLFAGKAGENSSACLKAREDFLRQFWEWHPNVSCCEKVMRVIDSVVETT